MLYIHLFGHTHLLADSEPWAFPARPKTLPLWAYLLLNRDQPSPRDSLAYLLWPDQPESEARSDLRRHLYELERALPPSPPEQPWILRQGETLQWNPEASYWLDVAEFERLSASPRHLARAVELYAGDLLPQVYDDWLAGERERLSYLYLIALRQLIAQRSADGDSPSAIAYAQQALSHDPLLEDIVRELMRLHYASGRRTEALQAYQTLKRRLNSEWGVAPAEETQALFDAISRAAPSMSALAPLPPAPAREPPRHNLPASLTSFIEREKEIAAIHRMLLSVASPVRLLTLVGPPGTGKTRLALEASRRLLERQASHFPDGMFFVDLSAVADPDGVLPAIAAVLDLKPERDQSFADTLKAHLRQAYALLILDNFEQVLEAGVAVSGLLAAAPQLHVIATSRAALKLYGEHEFPVNPLSLPDSGNLLDAGTLCEYGAIALFEARASQRQPGFALDAENGADVAEVCLQLDGLPLAIELAAGQILTLSPAEISRQVRSRLALLATELRDVSARHRTLEAAIGWSYDLLDERIQRLFQQLAVFVGGWTLEAAQVVCDSVGLGQMSDALNTLEDTSLIQRSSEGRYQMLVTIREYAVEQLAHEPASEAVCQRHAGYFADLVESLNRQWWGDHIKQILAQLDLEEGNLRAALGWALTEGEIPLAERAQIGARLATVSSKYWQVRGRLDEGRAWLIRALDYRQHLPLRLLIKTIGRLGWYMQFEANFEAARAILEDGLNLARQSEEPMLLGQMLHDLGSLAGRQADYPRAEQLLEEAAVLKRESSTVIDLTATLSNLAIVCKYLEKYDRARSILQEILASQREAKVDIEIGATLTNLGNLALVMKEYASAEAYYREALQLLHTLDSRIDLCVLFPGMAELALAQELPLRSARLYGFAVEFFQRLNFVPDRTIRERFERDKAVLAEHLGEAQAEALLAEGAAMSLDEAVAYALQA